MGAPPPRGGRRARFAADVARRVAAEGLGEGGYREKAARRLRAQVQLMETLIAKTLELPLQDPDALGAPAAIIADVVQ